MPRQHSALPCWWGQRAEQVTQPVTKLLLLPLWALNFKSFPSHSQCKTLLTSATNSRSYTVNKIRHSAAWHPTPHTIFRVGFVHFQGRFPARKRETRCWSPVLQKPETLGFKVLPAWCTEQLFWVITEAVIMPLESHEAELTATQMQPCKLWTPFAWIKSWPKPSFRAAQPCYLIKPHAFPSEGNSALGEILLRSNSAEKQGEDPLCACTHPPGCAGSPARAFCALLWIFMNLREFSRLQPRSRGLCSPGGRARSAPRVEKPGESQQEITKKVWSMIKYCELASCRAPRLSVTSLAQPPHFQVPSVKRAMINSPAVFQACFCLEANLAIKLIVKYFLPENKKGVSPRLGKMQLPADLRS